MSEIVAYRIAFDPSRSGSHPSDEKKTVGDPCEAAEIAVEMANRPGGAGGPVIIGTTRQYARDSRIYLTLVEPGDSAYQIERDVREKAAR